MRAGGAFLLAAGWSAVQGGIPPGWAQGAAFLALVAGAAGCLTGKGGPVLAAAFLMGFARSPSLQPALGPPRPVALQGRLRTARRDPEGGWRGELDRLAGPDGRPLDRPERRLTWFSLNDPARRGAPAGGGGPTRGGAPTEGGAPPPAGTGLRVTGLLVPGRADPRLVKAAWTCAAPGSQPPLSPLAGMRQVVSRRLDEALPPAEAGMGRALLLGDRSAVPEERYQAYRRLGLLHLLAVSGLHLWLWDALLRLLLRGPFRALRPALLGAAALLAGARPAVVRALSMIFLRDFLARRGRRAGGAPLLAAALWVELAILAPRSAGVGLLLSYSATAALIFTRAPAGASRLRKVFQPSLGAFLGTAPWLHALQGTLEPWSVPLTPLLALFLPFRLILSALACLPGPWGIPAAFLLRGLGLGEGTLLGWCEHLPASPWCLPQVSSLQVAAVCLAGILLLHRPTLRRALLAGALLLAAISVSPRSRPGLAALQVGHGLAVVVAGEQASLLFDLGSGELSPPTLLDRRLLPFLAQRHWPLPHQGIASHADHDHVNGFPLFARRTRLEFLRVPAGSARRLPGLEPFQARLFGCRAAGIGQSNAGGRVLEIRSPGFRAVVIGDQFGYSLRELLGRLEPGPIDVLLLPHHGLTTDGLPELLDHLQPREAWASCGAGDPPLPAAPVLKRRGIRLRTTLQGSLVREAQPSP